MNQKSSVRTLIRKSEVADASWRKADAHRTLFAQMARETEKLAAMGERIRELKQMSRKTSREIADASGVTERQVSRWLAGDMKGGIERDNLERLAIYLGSTPDYIEYGEMRRVPGSTPGPVATTGTMAEILGLLQEQNAIFAEMRDEMRLMRERLNAPREREVVRALSLLVNDKNG